MIEFDESIFDSEDFYDEDFAEVDALIEYLQSLPRAPILILNPMRLQQMRFSAAMLNKLLRETGNTANIECKQHEAEFSAGVIRVESFDISIVDMEGFARAAEFASNIEIYPLAENKIRMALMFYGLTIPAGA